MRELKFRRYDDYEFVFFDLVDFRKYDETPFVVQKYPIEQYTGLKDKNGKEIYEGDIMNDGNHICKIKWSEHFTAFEALNEDEGYESNVWFEAKYGEVIGNVHENPELLEKEE